MKNNTLHLLLIVVPVFQFKTLLFMKSSYTETICYHWDFEIELFMSFIGRLNTFKFKCLIVKTGIIA
jgi:hypothetical protein